MSDHIVTQATSRSTSGGRRRRSEPRDPRQKGRLAERIANLKDRIDEAKAYGWLGEVQGLQVSLDAGQGQDGQPRQGRAKPAGR